MAKRFEEGVRRLSIFCGIVASCLYAVWASLSFALESEMFQRDVWWLLLWWMGGLVVCFFTVWGFIRAVAWVVGGVMRRHGEE